MGPPADRMGTTTLEAGLSRGHRDVFLRGQTGHSCRAGARRLARSVVRVNASHPARTDCSSVRHYGSGEVRFWTRSTTERLAHRENNNNRTRLELTHCTAERRTMDSNQADLQQQLEA